MTQQDMVNLAWVVLELFNAFAIVFYVLLNGTYMVTCFLAFPALLRHTGRLRALDFEEVLTAAGAPPITIVAPAYNEETTVVEALRSFLGVYYTNIEVILVNDGSTDGTHEAIHREWDLVERTRHPVGGLEAAPVRRCFQSRTDPRLWVVEKENNNSRGDAINAGLNFVRNPLVCLCDADEILEPDCLIRAVLPFLEDAHTVAAGGIIRVANGAQIENGRVHGVRLPDSLWARFQILEYLRSFLAGRLGWELVGMTFFVSGGWGLFRRAAVLDVGGVPTDSMAEDMDLSLALHTAHIEKDRPYRITFIPEVVCWTEVPSDLRTLMNQRDRWQRGIIKSLLPYRKILFRPKYGGLGMGSFPFYYLLEMPAPIIELCGLFSLIALLAAGRVSTPHLVAYLSLTVLWSTAISIAGLTLSQLNRRHYNNPLDLIRLVFLSFFEHIIYKPVRLVAQWRGIFGLLRGKSTWGKMKRAGFQDGKQDEGESERDDEWGGVAPLSQSMSTISLADLQRVTREAQERSASGSVPPRRPESADDDSSDEKRSGAGE